MTKATELAKQAGIPPRVWKREIEVFYTLARADYEAELSAVMPADFKDWHEGSRNEWPELAAWVITNLREQRAELEAENEKLRQMLVSFTESDYIKNQHPKRYAVARTLLGETK